MKMLNITKIDTILGDDFSEMILDDFFAVLDKNIGEQYAVYYEEDNSRFKIIYEGQTWFLTFENTIMENYAFGIYDNPYTERLHMLVEKTNNYNKKKNEILDEEGEEARKQAAIEKETARLHKMFQKADAGTLPSNYDDLKQYIEYLKESRSFSFDKIRDYWSEFCFDIEAELFEQGAHVEKQIDKILDRFNLWFDSKEIIFNSGLIMLLFLGLGVLLSAGFYLLAYFAFSVLMDLGGQQFINLLEKIIACLYCCGFVTGLPFETVLFLTGRSIVRERKESKKILDYKIEKLLQLLQGYSPQKMSEIELELFPDLKETLESVEINDYVVLDFYKLLNMAKYLNQTDMTRIKKTILANLKTYQEKKRTLQEMELQEELTAIKGNYRAKIVDEFLNPQTILGLRFKYIPIVAELELEIRTIRKHDVESRRSQADFAAINDMIDRSFPVEKEGQKKIIYGYNHSGEKKFTCLI